MIASVVRFAVNTLFSNTEVFYFNANSRLQSLLTGSSERARRLPRSQENPTHRKLIWLDIITIWV